MMPKECVIDANHEFQSRSGALKLFRDGTFTGDWVCPSCVEDIQDDKNPNYRIFVMEGREVVIPTKQIDV
ncbi:MAG: hypothetical protein ABEK50_15925 [bacterium]